MQVVSSKSLAPQAADRPIRVLHCIPTLSGGGAERQLKMLAPALVRKGVDVAIFSRFQPADQEVLANAGVTCFPVESRGHHNPRLGFELWRVVQAFKPSIVQSWLLQMDVLCGLVPLGGAKWVLSERCSPQLYQTRGAVGLKDWLRRSLGLRSDMVVANSRSGLAVWPRARARMVIPNAVELGETLRSGPGTQPQTMRYRGRKVILSIGRLTRQKRPECLIEAMDKLRGRMPDALLVLLGDGEERLALEQLVRHRGLGGHVVFEGFQTDVAPWFQEARVFASASAFEGQPNAVLEAASARVPLVLSDIPEHRDTVGQGAIYADPAASDCFAEAIMTVLRDHTLGDRLARSARAQVESACIDTIARSYADLYRQLTDRQNLSRVGAVAGAPDLI